LLNVRIVISEQHLLVEQGGRIIKEYGVSTSRFGPGELSGSQCTPRGRHVVRAKIGFGLPNGAVLVGRRATGEIYNDELGRNNPGRDWILSRIIWLSGVEPGRNRLGDRDSMRRFIYIHGTPDTEPMRVPMSHGCIRMRNHDVIELFDKVRTGTPVELIP
jgi:L,D-transpeptidase YbiS